LLHHLADSGQGFPADSQRGAIALAIDARTLLRLAFPKPESTSRETSLVQGEMSNNEHRPKACATKAMMSSNEHQRKGLRNERQDEQHRTPNKTSNLMHPG
jgi:hypothetical protein